MEVIRRDGDYALRALVSMARRKGPGSVTLADLAAQERIPAEYLRKIFLKLARAGIVRSRRGVGGGYALARPCDDLTLLEIVRAVQGPVAMNRCQRPTQSSRRRCARRARCSILPHIEIAQAALASSLDSVTLASLAAPTRRTMEGRT